LTIWAGAQPQARAASSAVRVVTGISTIRLSRPNLVNASATREALVGSVDSIMALPVQSMQDDAKVRQDPDPFWHIACAARS